MGKFSNRTFEIELAGAKQTLYFKKPNQEELFEIDLIYRKVLALLLRQGCMMESEAEKLFEKSDTWTKKDDEQIEECTKRIAELSIMLDKTSKDYEKSGEISDEDRDNALELVHLISLERAELSKMINKRTEIFSNTAESQANEQKMHKFAELCCYHKETDQRFFEDHEQYTEFLAENQTVASEIYKETYYFEYGLPEDLTSEWSEIKFLKRAGEEGERKFRELEAKKEQKKKTRKVANKSKKINRKKKKDK